MFNIHKLIGFRGTHEEIIERLSRLMVGRTKPPILDPFEEPLKHNDYGFNTNLGRIDDTYLDYEIYMLRTNAPDVWYITEINPF